MFGDDFADFREAFGTFEREGFEAVRARVGEVDGARAGKDMIQGIRRSDLVEKRKIMIYCET